LGDRSHAALGRVVELRAAGRGEGGGSLGGDRGGECAVAAPLAGCYRTNLASAPAPAPGAHMYVHAHGRQHSALGGAGNAAKISSSLAMESYKRRMDVCGGAAGGGDGSQRPLFVFSVRLPLLSAPVDVAVCTSLTACNPLDPEILQPLMLVPELTLHLHGVTPSPYSAAARPTHDPDESTAGSCLSWYPTANPPAATQAKPSPLKVPALLNPLKSAS
jgi:hypothetical protein